MIAPIGMKKVLCAVFSGAQIVAKVGGCLAAMRYRAVERKLAHQASMTV
jgi:hypothetical protein